MDANFRKRLRRQLYYGDKGDLDNPSLPLTELTVEYFRESVSQKLGHVDLDVASNLVKRNNVSPCSMVLSLLYAKRLRQRNSDYLNSISSTDVFFISMMMASKYIYDEGVDEEVFNDEWAEKTEQDVDDVNQMEIDFLQAMDWRLMVRPEEFETALVDVEKRIALREGLGRGWFTYAELAVLADMNLLSNLWNNVGLDCSKVSAILGAAYLTGMISMIGSAAIAAQVSGPLSSAVIAALSTQLSSSILPNLPALPLCNRTGFDSGSPVWQRGNFDISDLVLDSQVNETDCSLGDGLCGATFGNSGHLVENSDPLPTAASPPSPAISFENDNAYKDEPPPTTESKDDPPTPKSKSSLLSILFLDSLLSQLLSVSASKSKVQHENGSSNRCMNKVHHENMSYAKRREKMCTTDKSACNLEQQTAFYHQHYHNLESATLPFESSSKQIASWLSHCKSSCQWKQNDYNPSYKESFTDGISTPSFSSLNCRQEELISNCWKCHPSSSDRTAFRMMNPDFGHMSYHSSPWMSNNPNNDFQTSLVTDAGMLRETLGSYGGLPRAIAVA